MRRGTSMIRKKTSMNYEACESYQRKMLQTIEKESLQSHRKVGQVKRCDEEFCLHCSRGDEDL